MKNQALDIIKDVFTNLLILACIVFVFAIIFYDDIALTKVIPELDDYTLTAQMQSELKDEEIDKIKEVVINYYIDGSDLKKEENNNKNYNGKSNPFGESPYYVEEGTNNNSSSDNTNNNSSGNFYEDDGTK